MCLKGVNRFAWNWKELVLTGKTVWLLHEKINMWKTTHSLLQYISVRSRLSTKIAFDWIWNTVRWLKVSHGVEVLMMWSCELLFFFNFFCSLPKFSLLFLSYCICILLLIFGGFLNVSIYPTPLFVYNQPI